MAELMEGLVRDQEVESEEGVELVTVKKDRIGDYYTVDLQVPLDDLSNDFVDAFAVHDERHPDDDSLYAVLFKPWVPVRMQLAEDLEQQSFPHVMCPCTTSRVVLSTGGERYGIVFSRSPVKSLDSLLSEELEFSESFIISHVITPLAKVLRFFENSGFVHGMINAYTIGLDDNDRLVVSECLSSPCGFYQPIAYEVVERGITLPIGKGEGTTADDFYALGVVVVYLLSRVSPSSLMDDDDIIEAKLSKGSFHVLCDTLELSPEMSDLLLGLLSDDVYERWGSAKLDSWLKGKHYNMVPPGLPVESTRTLLFEDKNYYNRKTLAQGMYMDWPGARRFLREDALPKWVEGSLQDSVLAGNLRSVEQLTHTEAKADRVIPSHDELVLRSILLLDPSGPLRFNGTFSVRLSGLGTMLAYAYATGNKNYLRVIEAIIESDLLSTWYATGDDTLLSAHLLWAYDNIHEHINKDYFGFGLERCLYDLNPTLPCQSPVLEGHYVLTLEDLYVALERVAGRQSVDKPLFDKHIMGFLASRLELTNEIRIKGLKRFPHMAVHPCIQSLALFVLGLKRASIRMLPQMTKAYSAQLSEVMEVLRSVSIREEIRTEYKRLIQDGSLGLLLKATSNPDYLIKDKMGYKRAIKEYRMLVYRKMAANNRTHVSNTGFRYGLQITVLISYLLLAVEVLYLVAVNM